ncbi:MAG: biopolymer transporter ExbD [Jhaorihella sp.]
MEIHDSPRRPAQESIVPMINVVFLLLVFFLLTAQIAPTDPVEVTAPHSDSGAQSDALGKLFLDSGGLLYFEDVTGADALQALLVHRSGTEPLLLVADRDVEAARLAALLRELAAAGLPGVELVVSPR